MPWDLLRGMRPRDSPARRGQPDAAPLGTLALGFLLLHIGLIWALPFLWKSSFAWEVEVTDRGRAHSRGTRTPHVRGELMLLRDGDEQDRSDANRSVLYHEFDLVEALERIVDHPRQFLKARYVTTARVLSESVTGPVFADPQPRLYNITTDLIGWLQRDTSDICMIIIQGTRNAIVSLAEQEKRCGLADPATSERPARDGAPKGAGAQDVHCSADNVHERAELRRYARDIEAKTKPACDQVDATLLSSMDLFKDRDSLLRFLQEVRYRMRKMKEELKLLGDVIFSLDKANSAIRDPPERTLQHLHRKKNIGGAGLDVLASRAGTGYAGGLDPFTAVLLYVVRGSPLLTSPTPMLESVWAQMSSSNKTTQWPTRGIRAELESQARVVNTASESLASIILPGTREWLALIRDVNDTGAFKMGINGDGNGDDNGEMEFEFRDSWRLKDRWRFRDRGSRIVSLRRRWADPNMADRMVKAVGNGAERFQFLRGYLVQIQHGLPCMLTRLDRWDAEVAQLANDLTLVLSSGTKHTGQRQKRGKSQARPQEPYKDGTSGSSDGGDPGLEVTRWQIHPSNLASVWLGLNKLEHGLNESWGLSESFNPQDSWKENWFETQMHRWNSERAALRAVWEVEQGHKERARRTFWQHVGNVMGLC